MERFLWREERLKLIWKAEALFTFSARRGVPPPTATTYVPLLVMPRICPPIEKYKYLLALIPQYQLARPAPLCLLGPQSTANPMVEKRLLRVHRRAYAPGARY